MALKGNRGMSDKAFTSPQYIWLERERQSDPKLQKLYEDLELYWIGYSTNRNRLEAMYKATLPKPAPSIGDLPWD